MADDFRRGLDCEGPGGVKCRCCVKFKNGEKPKLRRIVRARMKARLQKEIKK